MGINPRTKGATGEREAASKFINLMIEVEAQFPEYIGASATVRRNVTQTQIGGDDLVGIPYLSIEVKRVEKLAPAVWFEQAKKSAARKKLKPVLIYRQSRREWRVRCFSVLSLPNGNRALDRWIIADFTLDEFLEWYRWIYMEWLLTQLKKG